MAIIEIGKIQVRRGLENQTGVPQLDGGEFAWAADTERLYIGLRREDGGSRDDNVEILTENHLKNFFQISYTSSTYIYREGSLITAPLNDPFNEHPRKVQDKLDDIVSVKDFGVLGNGNVDGDTLQWDMARLQLAIDRLFLDTQFLSTSTIHPRKKLYFPAGTYNFTSTLYVPAYTTIIGDGIGKTIFNLTTTTAFADSLIKTCDLSSAGGTTGYKHFDSNGGSGVDFTNTGTARHVVIQDLTLQFDPAGTTVSNAMSLVSLDCADNSVIKNVEFVGHYTDELSALTTSGYLAVNLRGKLADGSNENTVIDNCVFRGVYSGIRSDWDIKSTVISNNDFSSMVKAVNFNDPVAGFVGPRFIRIINNKFDLVREQAIYVGDNGSATTGSFVTSQNNIFDRVGYSSDWGDIGQTATSVISFLSRENSSVNDHYGRARVHREYLNTSSVYYKPLVDGRTTIENFYVTTATVSPGVTPTPILRLPITGNSQHLNIKYSAFRPDAGLFVTTATSSVTASFTVTVADLSGIVVNSSVTATGITPPTYVIGFNTGTSEVTFDNTATITAGDLLYFVFGIDRMGNLGVYLQDSSNPDFLIVDDYNYINYDGGITFGVTVDAGRGYYQINGSLSPEVTVPVIVEFQNKLMI